VESEVQIKGWVGKKEEEEDEEIDEEDEEEDEEGDKEADEGLVDLEESYVWV
jgi:hypothetical protein